MNLVLQLILSLLMLLLLCRMNIHQKNCCIYCISSFLLSDFFCVDVLIIAISLFQVLVIMLLYCIFNVAYSFYIGRKAFSFVYPQFN